MSYDPSEVSKKGGFKREKGTGEFVREYLEKNGPTHIQGLQKKFREWCKEKGYKHPRVDQFRSYFWLLKELDLVEFVKEKETDWGENQRLFKLNEDLKNSAAWKNPRKHYDHQR